MGKQKNKSARDSNGDIKVEYKIDWQKIHQDRHLYIFQYYDKKKEYFFPCFNLFGTSDPKFKEVKQDTQYFEKQLYYTPDQPPFDFYIGYHNWQLELLITFFKEVFEEKAFVEGYEPMHKYFKLILPKATHDQIINCINDYELLQIRDLLFEVIAIAQQKYIEDIAYWERPEMQKLIRSAGKQTSKVIELIDRLDNNKWMRGDKVAKKPSRLQYINFVLNDGTIKIDHQWLAEEFISHFKSHYDNQHYKNWKLNLAIYPERFKDNITKQHFKYGLAKSLYNLFTKRGFFNVTEKEPTPNDLMLCISKLIEFCLIPVASSGEIDGIKIKNIRNWLKRKELKEDITYLEVPANKKRMLEYFDKDFVGAATDIKRADALTIGMFIAKRFDLDHLFPDLAHIAQALKEVKVPITHQMFYNGVRGSSPFSEFESLQKLTLSVKDKQKITTLKFKLDGDKKEYELTQRLPLFLVERALKEYAESHQVEFDTDLVKTKVTKTTKGFKIENKKQFNLPEERFMVRFVKSFYMYLMAEAPPAENEFAPSERYYAIIGEMLQKTWFFYHQRNPDWFVIAKVKEWHSLATQ